MGEIEAAIGIEQLKKLDYLVKSRQEVAKKLTDGLKDLIGLRTPYIKKETLMHFMCIRLYLI